jgi:CBS domain-containing protein
MRTVRDVMSGEIEVLRTTESAADAASFLAAHDVDSIPLCQSDGSLAGSVSARDILAKVVAKGLDAREVPLSEFAEAADVLALDVDVPVDEAVTIMCRHHKTRLPVVEGDRVVGLVTQRDVARSIAFRTSWSDGLDDLRL